MEVFANRKGADLARKFMPDAPLFVAESDAKEDARVQWNKGWRAGFALGVLWGFALAIGLSVFSP